MKKPDTYAVWRKSGESRQMKSIAWGMVDDGGLLATGMHGTPFLALTKRAAMAHKRRGERPIRLSVTIRAIL